MKLTFLGTGTSFGVPVIGCHCPRCTSEDPRDRRTRHGAVLTFPEGNLLVDAPPELRLQLVQAGIDHIDAVWITHLHADHVHGADDLRIFRFRAKKDMPVFCPGGLPPRVPEAVSRTSSMRRFIRRREAPFPSSASTDSGLRTPGDSGPGVPPPPDSPRHRPRCSGSGWGPGVYHGCQEPSSPDPGGPEGGKGAGSQRPLVGNPHPTHFNVEEAVEAAAEVGAERTYLTHMTHEVGHQELLDTLPPGVEPAYDGLTDRAFTED